MSGFSTTSFFVCSPKEEVVMDWTASLRRPSFLLLVTILVIATAANAELNTNQDEATLFLEQLDPTYLREANAQMTTRWQYMTDITDEHAQAQVSLLLNKLCNLNLRHLMVSRIMLILLTVAVQQLISYLLFSYLFLSCP